MFNDEIFYAYATTTLRPQLQKRFIHGALRNGGFAAFLRKEIAGNDEALSVLLKNKVIEADYEKYRCSADDLQIIAVPITSPLYPPLLLKIDTPPPLLWVKGNIKFERAISIVGSRAATIEGCDIARDCANLISAAGITMISGLALGIDGAAHEGALKIHSQNPTIAVLANGLDKIYPTRHEELADRILSRGGGLVSEFPPGTPAFPAHFLQRNRIIAGMSELSLVIQAGHRSGALVTARHALENNRGVCVVPGCIIDPLYKGSNELLKSGAAPVTHPMDLLHQLGIDPPTLKSFKDGRADSDPIKGKILQALNDGEPKTPDEIKCDIPIEEISACLLEQELSGLVTRLPGNRFKLLPS